MKKSEFVLALTTALALPIILTFVQVVLLAEPAVPSVSYPYPASSSHVLSVEASAR